MPPMETQVLPLTLHRRPLQALTGIRFFAAFHVVLFHSRVGSALHQAGFAAAGNFFSAGHLAVTLFFVLSGFILAYTYQGQIESHADQVRFWQARFARLWPAYAASLLACSLQSHSIPGPLPALATLAMVQAWNPWNPGLAGTWNFVCWTLSAEAFFYLLFPFVQRRLEQLTPRLSLVLTFGLLLLSLLTNSSMKDLAFHAVGLFRFVPLPLIHLPEFLTGVLLGNLFLAQVRSRAQLPLLGSGLWTYLALAASLAILSAPEGRWTSIVVSAFALLVYSLATEDTLLSRFLSSPALVLGGGISYSVYLFQLPVKAWVASVGTQLGFGSSWTRLLLTAVALTLVSWLTFRFLEDPCRLAIRRAFAAWDQRHRLAVN